MPVLSLIICYDSISVHKRTCPKVSSPGDNTCSDGNVPPVTQTLAEAVLGAGLVKVCVIGGTLHTLHVSTRGLLMFGHVTLQQTPSTGPVRRLYDLRLRSASLAMAFVHQLPDCTSKSKLAWSAVAAHVLVSSCCSKEFCLKSDAVLKQCLMAYGSLLSCFCGLSVCALGCIIVTAYG